MEKIIIGKMNNGITILGKDDGEGGIKEAVCLKITPQQNGIAVAVIPFYYGLSEALVHVKSKHVIAPIDAPKDVCEEYIKATSGIQIVGANALNNIIKG